MSKYKAIITTAGAAKIAAASAGGTQLKIVRMAVGDGNGTLPTPSPAQTTLVNETYRAALNGLTIDKTLKNHILAEMIIPANVGGWWLREMGLYDEDGTLIAVSNMAESYKPKLEEGSGRTQTLRMILIVSSTEAIQVIAGGDTVLATKDYVTDAIVEHEKTRNHPDASTTAKGLVQLSSATTSTDETKASTPKALKTVSDASMKKDANLSDLTNKAAARGNLALGDAATRNVGIEGGQLMAVGAFGLGMGPRHFDDAYCNSAQIYRVNGSSINAPGNGVYGVLSLPCDGGPSGSYVSIQANGNAFVGWSNISANGVLWSQVYTTKFKPTAADIGALTDVQAAQKYALRSIKVNGQPLSADVNLLASDVNAWSKTEADGRYLAKTGGQLTGPVTTSAEIQSISSDNYRLIGGDYGSFWRNDGTALYLMLTNAKDQAGTWNSLRPFTVDVKTGQATFAHAVGMNSNLTVNGHIRGDRNLSVGEDLYVDRNATVTGSLKVGASTHSSDGNILGSRWGNKWLWDAIVEQDNGRVDWGSFNREVGARATIDYVNNVINGRVDWGSFANRTHEGPGWWRDENTGILFQYGRFSSLGINENANLWQPFNISFTQWVGPILLSPWWPDRSSWGDAFDYAPILGSNNNQGFNWNKQVFGNSHGDWNCGMTWFAIGK
ncbi:phage tail protein [Serratia nevei]|uniref:phage tail protein n=1 Tax=Serratia nevei TaxID=2703794 RepID=UPI00209E9175|nr:phage tail protein [Serratia nevei]MCP1107500.1 phage tail protein [Serratia nevei]